jgi:hypothetical protein
MQTARYSSPSIRTSASIATIRRQARRPHSLRFRRRPWGIAIDGNDNVWVANATGRSVTHLCGARPENCPPGTKTGDPISPPGGYIGGLQIITDVAIDPAGNVWVANNWDRPDEGFKKVPAPAQSTRFGGNGTVVFFGLAKPVRTPLIGPPRQP